MVILNTEWKIDVKERNRRRNINKKKWENFWKKRLKIWFLKLLNRLKSTRIIWKKARFRNLRLYRKNLYIVILSVMVVEWALLSELDINALFLKILIFVSIVKLLRNILIHFWRLKLSNRLQKLLLLLWRKNKIREEMNLKLEILANSKTLIVIILDKIKFPIIYKMSIKMSRNKFCWIVKEKIQFLHFCSKSWPMLLIVKHKINLNNNRLIHQKKNKKKKKKSKVLWLNLSKTRMSKSRVKKKKALKKLMMKKNYSLKKINLLFRKFNKKK